MVLHPSMLLYVLYACLTSHGTYLLISTVSILLHELAHALTASLMGSPPFAIELTPLGAVMRLEDDEKLPSFQRLLMLLSGPLLTLLLCCTALNLSSKTSLIFSRQLFLCNLSILTLNLLPVLPLDGGRILSLLLRKLLPARKVNCVMQVLGKAAGISLILLNIWTSWKIGGWNLSLAFAGCCILYSTSVATVSQAAAELRQFMDRKISLEKSGSQGCKLVIYACRTPLRKIIRELPPSKMLCVGCIEPGTMKMIGWIEEHRIIQAYLQTPDMSIGDLIACQRTG